MDLDFKITKFEDIAYYFMKAKAGPLASKDRASGESLCVGAAQFQIAGGFVLPSDQTFLDRFTEENIKNRIETISETNIIAASEVDVKNKKNIALNQYTNIVGLIDKKTTVDDTCFISKKSNITAFSLIDPDPMVANDEIRNYSTITYKTKQITSIHLSGDGPIAPKKPKDAPKDALKPPPQSIEQFLSSEFTKYGLVGKEISVICGDTNITTGKTLGGLTRETIGKQISLALKNIFIGDWLVIMSELKIDKIRTGSFLRNPQIEKSKFKKEGDDGEADGTILAIKLGNDNMTLNAINDMDFPNYYSFYLNDECKLGTSRNETYFSFQTDNNNCLEKPNNKLKDRIFLDHSVLQIPLNNLNRLLGIVDDENEDTTSNLIVLNLGSMQNSGLKSWYLKYVKFQNLITTLDTTVYNYIKSFNSNLPNYNTIIGSKMLTKEEKKDGIIGIDQQPITTITQDQLTMLCNIIQQVIKLFDENLTANAESLISRFNIILNPLSTAIATVGFKPSANNGLVWSTGPKRGGTKNCRKRSLRKKRLSKSSRSKRLSRSSRRKTTHK